MQVQAEIVQAEGLAKACVCKQPPQVCGRAIVSCVQLRARAQARLVVPRDESSALAFKELSTFSACVATSSFAVYLMTFNTCVHHCLTSRYWHTERVLARTKLAPVACTF